MARDAWPSYCRALLAASISSAARQFTGRGDMAPERVHGLRKTLKEARALARLFLGSVGEPARVTITSLAAARRRVASARDLDVIEARLDRLAPPHDVAASLSAAIARGRAVARRGHTTLATRASRAQLEAIAKRLETLDLGGMNDGDIVSAVARTYRQARRRGGLAFATDNPAALHALRSRVVDLRYQLAALSPAWPAALNAQSEELNALRDSLGDSNDLHVFATFAAEQGGLSPEALGALAEQLDARQKKLRHRAEVEFRRLFVESPAAFAHRLAAWLEEPMKQPQIKRRKQEGEPAEPEAS